MYKFEIYKSTQSPSGSDTLSDGIRYNDDLYLFERAIDPIWDDLNIQGKKEDGRKFFREELGGDLTLTGEDYDWVYTIFTDRDELSKYRYIKISEKVDGLWSEVWRGFFNVADGEFNLSRCNAVFSDLLVFDEYSPVIENISNKKNLIDVTKSLIDVSYSKNTYKYDELIVTSEVTANTETEFCNNSYISYPSPYTGIKYVMYTKEYNLMSGKLIQTTNGDCVYSAKFSVKKTYRRDYQWAAENPDPATWDEDTDAGEDINGNKKWVRYFQGNGSPVYTLAKNSVGYQVIRPSEDELICNRCTLYEGVYTLNASEDSTFVNERGRLFLDVVGYLIEQLISYSSPISPFVPKYFSEFLTSINNPITGEANTLNILMLWQLSDMKDTSDEATIGMISLEDIEKFILMFNAYWYIDEYGRFRIEHEKYFDLGLSYNGAVEGLDISSGDGYEMSKGNLIIRYTDDLPQKESHTFAYSISPDFVGVPMVYHGNIVNRGEDSSFKDYNFSPITTDLNQVVSNQESIGDDGFFIASTYYDISTSTLMVHSPNGILSGVDNLSNGYLAPSYLQERYWKWGRPLSKGIINRVEQELTQKNILIHEDIVIVNCGEFDPYKLVKTEFGSGRVEEYTKSLNNKRLTLTLSYSA